jgi:hypothetical protein
LIRVGLIKDFVYKENKETPKQSITENQRPLENIVSHFSYPDKPSLVDMEFHISNNDKENMLFLQKEQEKISEIIQKYSTTAYQIPKCDTQKIKNLQTLHIQFSIDTKNKIVHITNKQKNKVDGFALEYIINQELFQIAIMIYNKQKKSDDL